MDQAVAKLELQKLIDKYKSVVSQNKVKTYNEENTKKGFIEPLFEILGWNIRDIDEVSTEVEVQSAGRADYSFSIDGYVRFYLEAKALKSDLNREEYANQAIRYSWNKGVNWAILTDFESLKIFYTQDPDQSLLSKLVFEIRFDEYLEKFDQLWLLSKESFKNGELELFARDRGKMMQRVSVGDQLYKHLNECREILTDKLGEWNNIKDRDLLDEGVQKLLDRLVFIRAAEDRGVEPPTLTPLIREWESNKREKGVEIYESMVNKFRELDEVYNSNLFSPHPFEKWIEHSNATKKVIEILQGKHGYYEYDFKVMPADVLGTVYENYLGHRLLQMEKGVSLDKNAKKRKEQGIYYTPEFIVDYIVRNTLGPILNKCKSINDLKKIKVLDPACGSGSFLIKALQVINEKYIAFGNPGNEFTKIMILQENIYGVDLDEQAVEIARLNLLINALEKRMELPKLDKNIKNGNSLISGTGEELKKEFGENYRDKKPFNWEGEFPEVFKQGGFNVVVGNPPYIKEFVNKSAFDGLHKNPYYQGKMDLWTMFACISIDLLKDGGVVGFIAPNNWLTNAGASIMRNKILADGELKTFIDFGDYKVFEQAGIQTMIYIFEKKKPNKKYEVDYLRINDKNISEEKIISSIFGKKAKIEIEPEKLIDKNITFSSQEFGLIFNKIESKKNFKLTEKEVAQGIVADPDKAFIFAESDNFSRAEIKKLKKYFTSVGRYSSGEQHGLIAYLDKSKDYDIEELVEIKTQLLEYRKELDNRREVKNGRLNWYNLHWSRDETFFISGPKIVGGIRVRQPNFFYTEDPYYGSRALNFIRTSRINLKYLTGVLNSKVSFFWLKNKGKQLGDLLQVDKGPLMDIPICIGSKNQQDEIINLVDRILTLNKELEDTPENSNKWTGLTTDIERVDKKIDDEVYKLYDLKQEEVDIVENFKN